MKTIRFIVVMILLFMFMSTYSQNDAMVFNCLKLHATSVEVTNTKTGKVKIDNEFESYFFFTEDGIYDADDYGFVHFKFIKYPAFRFKYSSSGDRIFKSIVIDAINVLTAENCIITINKNVSDSIYIMTFRYESFLLKYDCKEFK
jgi:hypothetical protein